MQRCDSALKASSFALGVLGGVYLVSLTCHHRASFDVVERDSALQEAGVLQQETKGSVRATNLENRWKTATILHGKGTVHGQKLWT